MSRDLLERVYDLRKQATTDHSHFYTRNVLEEVIEYMERTLPIMAEIDRIAMNQLQKVMKQR